MATNTEHYNLVKPDYADAADVAQLNDNMDIIDSILWQLANAGADEELLKKVQEILDKIGETADTGGSTTLGSVMAKLNEDLKLDGSALQEIINLGVIINGEASPYGTGLLGDVTFNSSKFTWPTQDYYNRYILQVESLTIPSGQTMKPPAKCDGLYILSKGDVTIDGNIDVRGLRKTFKAVTISPTINVGTKTFELAKGGYAPKGGANGASGKIVGARNLNDETGEVLQTFTSESPSNSIAGNVNGGGVGTAISTTEYATGDYSNGNVTTQKHGQKIIVYGTAPTALIIIAKGTVTINGEIIANASNGVSATAGTQSAIDIGNIDGKSGVGGTGAIPCSGGGCITIICNQLSCNGEINTNGDTFTSPDGTSYNTQKKYMTGANVYGGAGGKGGTFISTAGEIKVYTGVSE